MVESMHFSGWTCFSSSAGDIKSLKLSLNFFIDKEVGAPLVELLRGFSKIMQKKFLM